MLHNGLPCQQHHKNGGWKWGWLSQSTNGMNHWQVTFLLVVGILLFFPPAQATVYKCEGDKSLTPLCAFKDEDVSFLGHSAVVHEVINVFARHASTVMLSRVNVVHLSCMQSCTYVCMYQLMLHFMTALSCCHMSTLPHVMVSHVNLIV